MEYKSEIINFEKEDAESKKRMLGSDKVNIEEIKKRHQHEKEKGSYINEQQCFDDREYLLSIIEQAEKALERAKDYLETFMHYGPAEAIDEALQAIRKGD